MPLGAADELLGHALEVPFSGWDLSVLGDRIVVEPPPWSFEQLVDDEVVHATSMLDMGTGGGEWLSRRRRAARTVATEGWTPNVPIASARLVPLGAVVVQDERAVDNVEQASGRPRGRLPFRAAAFELVVNRHEAFVASEVRRVLGAGGVFLTQQASSGAQQFHRLLDLEPPRDEDFHLDLALEQLERGGLRVEQSGAGIATTVFADVGALAWYLSNVPWAVPGFSIARYRETLVGLHGDPIRVNSERFWIRAIA